jgi:murein DD-endopeptidase MepM/ murein hydrolase activator NlpD
LWAENDCYCPAQIALKLNAHDGLEVDPDAGIIAIVPERDSVKLMSLRPVDGAVGQWQPDFEFAFIFGDPDAHHAPTEAYRPPFAAATRFVVSHAFPDAVTHATPDSRYAIDIAMPEQTPIYAARGGIVVEVAHNNFKGGADWQKYGAQANIVKIMHDDGSFAIYAHLSWDSIRVRPGQTIRRGEFIAASGNTGFSTGPHLHFVVVQNQGLRSVSLPIRFSDGLGGDVEAESGTYLSNP